MSKLGFLFLFLYAFSIKAMTPSEAYQKLMKGNARFKKSQTAKERRDSTTRMALSSGQNPFAVIVACADSRVAPEILFDQGIGDLFVVRVAGNVVGPLEMESIEYAVKYLGSAYVLVMGHQNCGAINAVIENQTADIRYIAQLVKKSVIKAKASPGSNVLQKAVKLNAEAMSNFIEQSSIISEMLQKGKVKVRAAYYDFESGSVEVL